MKILIVAAGSHGDVLPFVGPGRELQRRGREVRLFASAPFATIAAEAGLPFVEVMSAAAGTANVSSQAFFEASVQACQLSGRRGLLLTQEATQLPAMLPPHVAHFGCVPFQALLPRLAALVHHGGIGTTSQALRAGTPQLVRPMGFDQFDNARRAVTLGVARQLLPRRYQPAAVVRALDELTTQPSVRADVPSGPGPLPASAPGRRWRPTRSWRSRPAGASCHDAPRHLCRTAAMKFSRSARMLRTTAGGASVRSWRADQRTSSTSTGARSMPLAERR